ncbi:exodeoxyribonuclease III [Fimbriimonas ginsengisoli]|uniref:Exodeoxyribonuclease III n=1 Tax=Fimbriimonas ginsengisoli Gsoil 348 TaxID=661478 RepID=A0A068NMJ6_FIMGI|nr:exodeoxyribonuclease III [Fimbriimonas ginsengisoli]AIE84597.1 exodeoxyribonuclease III [Fimbriimonas ginsengisoli Gsoil 348]
MKLFSWNVNGIRAVLRKDMFGPFVATEKPDVLCLQETKAQPHEAVVDLPDYEEYWNSADKKGYSGTGILTKTKPLTVQRGLPAEILAKYDMSTDGYGDPNAEGRVLMAEFEKFFLVTVYTPNAKDDLSRIPLRRDHWDPAFLEYCQLLEKSKPVVFCGDLNVAHTELDLANPKPNMGKKGFTLEERAGFQAFLDAGYIDTFRIFTQGNGHYTWWSQMGGARARNVGWRIDYFLVSSGLRDKVTAAEIHASVMGSDHCPISLTLDL